jgi:hypothetical protein
MPLFRHPHITWSNGAIGSRKRFFGFEGLAGFPKRLQWNEQYACRAAAPAPAPIMPSFNVPFSPRVALVALVSQGRLFAPHFAAQLESRRTGLGQRIPVTTRVVGEYDVPNRG